MSRSTVDTSDFFADYGEANRYVIKEIIGKGSYGVVSSALDTVTGQTTPTSNPQDVTCLLREQSGHQEDHQCLRPRLGRNQNPEGN